MDKSDRDVALAILDKLDDVMAVNWNLKEVYIKKIVEALEGSRDD